MAAVANLGRSPRLPRPNPTHTSCPLPQVFDGTVGGDVEALGRLTEDDLRFLFG